MRWLWCIWTVLALGATSCGGDDDAGATSSPSGSDITVFAAASLTDAFTELGEAFGEAEPGASATFNFAASSELARQLLEGARADVFASADEANMSKLTDGGGAAGEPVTFATNRLEIITAPGNPLGITGLADLAKPELIVVTCAVEVPCGTYAEQVFSNAGVTVTPKSYEENVRAVANKVTLGEADAGIVYSTDVTAAGEDAGGVEIPDDVNVVAEYPIAVTAESGDPDTARAFVDFVLGEEGQAILARYGFAPP
jgi:molybdate transport system substrate-binding protein